ncbi:LysR family transcriptional regulator [Jiangella muralis]|uniref:LysR family transcriptional regulator n=1 Tax=Jiangella muralis TaxID=702383 RepID=UPI00069D017A|nr:LysR family transcriptional regulator [Jiangella muralis]
MPDVDTRLLRHFVAVAQELHFGRAAARLFVAQQALSRDIARLERDLGVRLFDRTTRKVTLTPPGERLLARAAELLAQHDAMLAELRDTTRPLLVDVMHDRSTALRVLETARPLAAGTELEARFHGGCDAAVRGLLAHRVDVVFGRLSGVRVALPPELTRRLLRLEPLGLMVLDDDPLARHDTVPLATLRGRTVDTSGGNPEAPEWVELGAELVRAHGGTVAPDHHPGMAAVAAAPPEETTHHLRATGWPVLTKTDAAPIPGTVVRPLTDPVPLYPWTMAHRAALRHPGLDALHRALDRLIPAEGWLDPPAGAWLPAADRALLPGG